MYFRSSPKLTIMFLALIVFSSSISFLSVKQVALAKSSSCTPALALCDGQPELGGSGGSPVGLAPFKGIPVSDTGKVNYYYAGAVDSFHAEGASGNFNQDAPYLAPGDAHTLAELAVETGDGRQIVEVGWIVDQAGAGPDLFVSYWVDGIWKGQNPSDFVHISNTPTPGDPVGVDSNPDETHQYVIRFFQGNWWIRYENTWIGYFPGKLWNNGNQNKFTQIDVTQWFGEVASLKRFPCSQMGDGILGTQPGSSLVNNMYFVVNGTAVNTNAQGIEPTSHYYDVDVMHLRNNSFTYGGPGDTTPQDCHR